jgi:hypothetical protein
MAFALDATPFGGTAAGDWNAGDRALIQGLRALYPELSAWGDLALGSAWGSYSQNIYAVSWVDWLAGRDDGFLAYLYVTQCRPEFDWGGTGLFMDDVWAYGETKPWTVAAPLPAWAQA